LPVLKFITNLLSCSRDFHVWCRGSHM